MAGHKPIKVMAILLGFVAYLVAVFFNVLSSTPLGSELGIMNNQTRYVADTYSTAITPDGWVFGVIWSIIYILQALILLYGFSTICTQWPKTRSYLYDRPAIIPFYFFIVYTANMAFNTAWVFVFDQEKIVASTVLLPFIPITLYLCNIISYRALDQVGAQLTREGLTKHIWIVRILVHNGIAFYATWTTIASYLNISIAILYANGKNASVDAPTNMPTACWTALGLLTGTVAAWFVAETFVFDKYLRYTFAPYIVLLLALSGSLTKNYDLEEPQSYSIYTAVLLGLCALLGVVKVVVMVRRHTRNPIHFKASGSMYKGDISM